MSAEIHVGDIGTLFRATIRDENKAIVSLSDAVSLLMIFRKPNKTYLTKTASVVGDGSTGQIYYITEENDLDIPGTWQIQGKIEKPTGSWSSDIYTCKIFANL